jgi:hypothetical protein
MANYPTQLPIPVRDGYQGTMPQKRHRFQMDDDLYSDVRRWGSQPFRYSLTWRLQLYEQAAIFEAWVEYTLNAGENWADIPLADRTVKMRAVDGKPSYKPVGMGWDVSMTFDELRSAPNMYIQQAVWPVTLPLLDKRDFTIMPTSGPAYSDIQEGLPEVRRRFRTRSTTYSGKILMNLQQRDIFWQFYRDAVQDGIAYFQAPFANSLGERLLRARISNSPSEAPEGCQFWITLSLETFEAPMLTYGQYLDLVSTFLSDYIDEGYFDTEYIGTVTIGV